MFRNIVSLSWASARRAFALLTITVVSLAVWVPAAPAARAAASPLGDRTGYAVGGHLQDRTAAELARELDLMVQSGTRWVRLDVNWASTERTRGVRDWAPMDRVVTAIHSRGMSVLGLITYAPAWARPAGSTSHTPPTSAAEFADFARAAAARYTSQGITAWEIWNEPNIHNFWAPAPDAAQYVELLKASAAAIRTVNPTATVVSGGLSPAHTSSDGRTISPLDFLRRMYALGAGSSFTAVGWHPYSFPHMPTTAGTQSWNAYMQMPLARELMVAQGDAGKKVWMTEVGAPTGTAADATTEQRQAEIVVEAVKHASTWSWAGPAFVYALRDAGTLASDREQNFGLVRRDYSLKPAFTALQTLLGGTAASTPVTTAPVAGERSVTEPVVAPAAPSGITATGAPRAVRVVWNASSADGLRGYHVYRTMQSPTTKGRTWSRMTSSPLTGTAHNDLAVRAGVRYWYRVTAVAALESAASGEATAVSTSAPRRRAGSLLTTVQLLARSSHQA